MSKQQERNHMETNNILKGKVVIDNPNLSPRKIFEKSIWYSILVKSNSFIFIRV